MDFTLSDKVKKRILYGAAAIAIAGLLALHYAQAIFVSAPQDPVLAGDITSTEILDKSIVNIDVNERAKIDATKLLFGGADLIPFGMADGVGTSTGLRFATTTDPSLSVGTTTPAAKALNVQGGALITGDVTVGALKATGTLNVGGQPLSFPTNTGANGNVLTTNGSGGLSWGSSGDVIQCGESWNAAATSSVIVENLPAREWYRVLFRATGKAAGGGGILRLNVDGGANYAQQQSDNSAAPSASSDATSFAWDSGGTIQAKFLAVDIISTSTAPKMVSYSGYVSGGAATVGIMTEGAGHWNNTTDTIHTIAILNSGGQTYNAGSGMKIYCSKD